MNNHNSGFISFLETTGQIIILSLCWVLCCIPIFTFGPACTALYYAVAKVVRCGRGNILPEFWHGFIDNFRMGTPLGIVILAYAVLAINSIYFSFTAQMSGPFRWIVGAFGILFLLLMLIVIPYIFPLLSRFNFRMKECVLNSFYFSCCNWRVTAKLLMILFVGGTVLYLIPYFSIWIPGVVAYWFSFIFEPALKKYMPNADDDAKTEADLWYLEL